MKNPFLPGDTMEFVTRVTAEKLAGFASGMVHPVYSTFALGQDAEWACRLFVLEMKEEGEEGVGSFLSVEHVSPALEGTEVRIVATLDAVNGNEVVCTYEVLAGNRLIAKGLQKQRILDSLRFERKLAQLAASKPDQE
jgi:predicted thioesterase